MPNNYSISSAPVVIATFLKNTQCQLDTSVNVRGNDTSPFCSFVGCLTQNKPLLQMLFSMSTGSTPPRITDVSSTRM